MTAMAELVRLGDFDRDEREPRWAQLVAETLMPMSVKLDLAARTDTGIFQRKALGDLSLARWDCPPSQGVRRPDDVRRGDPETVVLFFAGAGTELVDYGSSKVLLSPAFGLLFSNSLSVSFHVDAGSQKQNLILPRV